MQRLKQGVSIMVRCGIIDWYLTFLRLQLRKEDVVKKPVSGKSGPKFLAPWKIKRLATPNWSPWNMATERK